MCERIISGVQHNIKHIIRFCTSIYFVFNLYSSWRTFDQTVILMLLVHSHKWSNTSYNILFICEAWPGQARGNDWCGYIGW